MVSPSTSSHPSVRGLRAELSKKNGKLSAEGIPQPGAGIGPFLSGQVDRDAEQASDVLVAQPGEVAQLDHPGRDRVFGGELAQGLVQGEDVVLGLRGGHVGEFDPPHPPPVFETILAASVLNQNPPHGLGRGGKEVGTTVPVLGLLHINQPQVRLMDQRGGLQCLARFFLSESLSGQLPQLVIDQRQQLLRGVGVALLDGGQDARDLAHKAKHNPRRGDGPASGAAWGSCTGPGTWPSSAPSPSRCSPPAIPTRPSGRASGRRPRPSPGSSTRTSCRSTRSARRTDGRSSPWNTSRAARWPSGWRGNSYPRATRPAWWRPWPKRCTWPTAATSFTATSSPGTCSWPARPTRRLSSASRR